MKTFVGVMLIIIMFVCLGYELFYGDKYPYDTKNKDEKN